MGGVAGLLEEAREGGGGGGCEGGLGAVVDRKVVEERECQRHELRVLEQVDNSREHAGVENALADLPEKSRQQNESLTNGNARGQIFLRT